MRIELTQALDLEDGMITHVAGDLPEVPDDLGQRLIDAGRARPFRPQRRRRIPGHEPVIMDIDLILQGRGNYRRGQVADLPTHIARQLVKDGNAAWYYPPDLITIHR